MFEKVSVSQASRKSHWFLGKMVFLRVGGGGGNGQTGCLEDLGGERRRVRRRVRRVREKRRRGRGYVVRRGVWRGGGGGWQGGGKGCGGGGGTN